MSSFPTIKVSCNYCGHRFKIDCALRQQDESIDVEIDIGSSDLRCECMEVME